jgi:hypothetical protein
MGPLGPALLTIPSVVAGGLDLLSPRQYPCPARKAVVTHAFDALLTFPVASNAQSELQVKEQDLFKAAS